MQLLKPFLDLTSEPVVSAAEPKKEGMREFEDETEEFPEPDIIIESNINRSTQTDEQLLKESGTQVSNTLLKLYIFFLDVCTFILIT